MQKVWGRHEGCVSRGGEGLFGTGGRRTAAAFVSQGVARLAGKCRNSILELQVKERV